MVCPIPYGDHNKHYSWMVKWVSLIKLITVWLSTVLNKSVTEDTVKYFSRMSHKLAHSTNMCITVSGIPQDWQVGGHHHTISMNCETTMTNSESVECDGIVVGTIRFRSPLYSTCYPFTLYSPIGQYTSKWRGRHTCFSRTAWPHLHFLYDFFKNKNASLLSILG